MGKQKDGEETLSMVRENFKNSTQDTTEHKVSEEYKPIADTESNTDTNGQISRKLNNILKHRNSIPKIGQIIKYLLENSKQRKEGTILSRVGKATGQKRNWLNIKDHGQEKSLDFNTGTISGRRHKKEVT